MTGFIIVGIILLVIVAVAFYKNNQKKVDQDIATVSKDAQGVINTANKVVDAVKKA